MIILGFYESHTYIIYFFHNSIIIIWRLFFLLFYISIYLHGILILYIDWIFFFKIIIYYEYIIFDDFF